MALKLVFLDNTVTDAKARIKALDTTNGNDWDSHDNPFYYSVVFDAKGHIYTHGIDFSCVDYFTGKNGVPVITTTNNITTVAYRSINSTNSTLSSESTAFVTESIIKQAIDNAVVGLSSAFVYKGTYTATSGTNIESANFTGGLTGVKKGWAWKVIEVDGTKNHFGSEIVENGDTIIANKDNASAQADFDIIQTNINWSGLSNNTFQIQANGTSVVTYNPTAEKTLNFVAGTNVTLTPGANIITIASTDTNTWRPFKMQNGSGTATDILGSGIDSGTLTFKAGDNMTLEYDTNNKVLTFKSSYVNTNTWRPINAYTISAASPSEVLGGGIGTNPLNFGSEFAYDEGDTSMTGHELHLVWAEVSNTTITYHV